PPAFSLTPPPPTPPLFPYTTLFRSDHRRGGAGQPQHVGPRACRPAPAILPRPGQERARRHRRLAPGLARPQRGAPAQRRRERRRSEEHTSELQSPCNLVCRLLLEKK